MQSDLSLVNGRFHDSIEIRGLHEAESTRALHSVSHNMMAGYLAKFGENGVEIFVRNVVVNVLYVKIGISHDWSLCDFGCVSGFICALVRSLI